MQIAETCPDCGAERPSWLGSPHHTRTLKGERHVRMCHDGKSPEEYFATWKPAVFHRLGTDRWPTI